MPAWLKHAFAVDPSGPATPSDEEAALVDRLARGVVRRGLTIPALMALDCSHNMNFLAGQALVFFAPIVRIAFDSREYGVFSRFLERRGSIEYICRRIETLADDAGRSETNSEDDPAPMARAGADQSRNV